jgi:hypothetical protein
MPAPGFSMEHDLANDRVWSVVAAVDDAWHELRETLLGALEYREVGTPHLRGCEGEISAAIRCVKGAERIGYAEVEATRAMLGRAD